MENEDYGMYKDNATDFLTREDTPVMNNGGLTTGELIKALEKFPKNTPVAISGAAQKGVSRIISVNDNHNYGNDNAGAIIVYDISV